MKNQEDRFADMTIGEALERIGQGGEESLALLKRIEGNTKPSASGTFIKDGVRYQQGTRITKPDSAATQSRANMKFALPAEAAKTSAPAMTIATPLRDESGKFISLTKEEKQAHAEGKSLVEILKGGAKTTWSEKKGDVRDVAGRAAMGPLWDVGKQIKETIDSAREKSDQGTPAELKKWAAARFGKDVKIAMGTQTSNKKLQKSVEDLGKAVKEKTQLEKKNGLKRTESNNPTVIQTQNADGGMLENILSGKMLKDMLPKKATGFLSKIPLLGKLFSSSSGAAGEAAPVAAKAGGLFSKVGKIGGRIPLIGGAISAGATLLSGGSKTEAAGSGIGAVAGGALGSIGGPVGTIAGSIAGEWIGRKLGGLFNKQNKAQDDLAKADEVLQQQQATQQQGFIASMGSMFSGLPEKLGALKDRVADSASSGYQAYKESRKSGGGFIDSLGAGIGAVAARFEGGKGGAGTISSGKGDFGGKSYGTFQLSSKQGSINSFLEKSGYASKFQGMQVGSKEFDAQWKDLAKSDPKFSEAQNGYAQQKYAAPQLAKLQSMGVDTSNRAIQEMAMSTGVQYGEGSDVLAKALKGKNASKMTPADIVNAVQDYKASSVGSRFKSSSSDVQAGVAKRHDGAERQALLSLTGETVGTPEYAAMQAKFIADQQATPPAPVPQKYKIAQALSTPAASSPTPVVATAMGTPHYKIPPPVQPIIPEPPKVQGMDELLIAVQQLSHQIQALQQIQQQNNKSNSDNDRMAVIPDIPTEFSDTMLTLIAYDRV